MSPEHQCATPGCNEPAVVSFDNHRLCLPHFISTGYERIDEYTRVISGHQLSHEGTETIWQFLLECIERAADATQSAKSLDNLQRARLLDILLRAADLSRHLRRGPRREAGIPVRLRCEKLGRAWEEETRTQVLSRYGALVECRHPVETNDVLTLARLDSGRDAKARVVWHRQGPSGVIELGLELLNCDNFWGLDWTDIPPGTNGTLPPHR